MKRTYEEWLKYYENATKEQVIEDTMYDMEEIDRLNKKCKRLQMAVDIYENPDDLTVFYMWLDERAKIKMKQLEEKVDRLNNIINKYRIGIEDMWIDNAGEDTWIYNGEDFLSREDFLDKLKELKENNNNG